MTLDANEKQVLSRHRIEKARALLRDAEMLLREGSHESSANRSYYAILAAAKGLLILRGFDPESHDAAKTLLSREFIKTGLLPKEFGETYRSLHARRLDSDYGDFVEITAHDAKDSLSKAQTFVRTVETLSESIIRENEHLE